LTNALQLVYPAITLGRGSQIAKTKLSVRKAEKGHGKKGQEGRKEATQASAVQSVYASGGNEVSQFKSWRPISVPREPAEGGQ
jgi:hypothetical protein